MLVATTEEELKPSRMKNLGIVMGLLGLLLMLWSAPIAWSWSKEGHVMTCQIAQAHLTPEASHAVRNLLPDYVNGNLSALCTWPDEIRHQYKYRWTSSLHFIDTPDNACSFDYSRDCHDPHGDKGMCVAGAIQNFTSQLLDYKQGHTYRKHNLTEALLFLSHFMGDIHQPLHVGFTSDEGGNTINLHWYRHKSNLHHVWDREIILTALKEMYDEETESFLQDMQSNIRDGTWSDEVESWEDCEGQLSCPNKYAEESINLACKWGYKDVTVGATLADEYFTSRLPIIRKRIAQGGVRLAAALNHIFRSHNDEL